MSGLRQLTCCWTRRIQSTVHYVVTLHPPLDLLQLYFAAPHLKRKLALAGLDELPPLALSHDRLHLLRLDVLVFAPLADAGTVLP